MFLNKKRKFKNLYGFSGEHNLIDVLKWKLFDKKEFDKKTKKERNQNYKLEVFKNNYILNSSEDYILWLGHSSFLIQIDGKKIITDPCLTAPPLFKRHTEIPIEIDKINPDYILVSHGHYDHLDENTVKFFDNSIALIPLKMTEIINKINPSIRVQEANWFEKYNLNEKFEIIFLPAHHWHRRKFSDRDEVLWGSFLIKTEKKTIYFAGDTGYSEHFKEIGEKYKIDTAIIPIGAFKPRWFMKSSHIDPIEAVQGFKDLKAKEFIPMHFGTFNLADELLEEPEKLLKEIQAKDKELNINFLTIGKEHFF